MKTLAEFKEGLNAANICLSTIAEYNSNMIDLLDQAVVISDKIRKEGTVEELIDEVVAWFKTQAAINHEILSRAIESARLSSNLGTPEEVMEMSLEYHMHDGVEEGLERSGHLLVALQRHHREMMDHPGSFRIKELAEYL